jgi:hypothetical protein
VWDVGRAGLREGPRVGAWRTLRVVVTVDSSSGLKTVMV